MNTSAMENKALFLLLFLFTFALSAKAQVDFSFGPKVGFNLNSYTKLNSLEQIEFENFNSFSGGLFARVGIEKIYLQPEAYFLIKGTNYALLNENGKIRMNAIDAPILLGYRLLKLPTFNLRVFAGPVLNLYLEEFQNDLKATNDAEWQDLAKNMANRAHSLQAGIGIDVLMFTLDARYERSLNQIYKALDIHQQQICFSLGYKIL